MIMQRLLGRKRPQELVEDPRPTTAYLKKYRETTDRHVDKDPQKGIGGM